MISIVVAMYNEEAVLPAFLNTFFEHIDLKEPYELLLVNDGSTDASVSIAKTFQKKHRQIRIVSYHPNRGLGHALQMGIAKARGRVIVTMDADLAHHPKYVSTLVDISDQGHDLVIGSRYFEGGGIDDKDLLGYWHGPRGHAGGRVGHRDGGGADDGFADIGGCGGQLAAGDGGCKHALLLLYPI